MYNLKIITSGDRLEIYKYNNYVVNNNAKDIVGDVFKEDKLKTNLQIKDTRTKEDRRSETLNNARNNIIRLIKANSDMKTFITLTFKIENNFKDSKKLLNNFFTKLRRDYDNVKYIWVLEYGSLNNRLHYHVLINISIEIKLNRSKEKKSTEHKELEEYFRLKYWKYGWVDIRQLEQEDNTNIALYVAAYITKDLIDKQLDGYRIYGYSRKTLKKSIVTKEYTTKSIDEILRMYKDNYDIQYSNSYNVGYSKDYRSYCGTVLYLDMTLRGD